MTHNREYIVRFGTRSYDGDKEIRVYQKTAGGDVDLFSIWAVNLDMSFFEACTKLPGKISYRVSVSWFDEEPIRSMDYIKQAVEEYVNPQRRYNGGVEVELNVIPNAIPIQS